MHASLLLLLLALALLLGVPLLFLPAGFLGGRTAPLLLESLPLAALLHLDALLLGLLGSSCLLGGLRLLGGEPLGFDLGGMRLDDGLELLAYDGDVNLLERRGGRPRRIEDTLSSGDAVLIQVTKDPIGHKGARLTSQVTLAGRYLVLVPGGTMTGISRKLPDTERSRLKKILKRIVPDDAGVIVRTAAEGADEEQLVADVERLVKQWQSIDKKSKRILSGSGKAPVLLKGEPELAVRVVRDVFNEDFRSLVVQGDAAWATISKYVRDLSPDLADRLEHWVRPEDVFTAHRIDEQLAKGFDRKV